MQLFPASCGVKLLWAEQVCCVMKITVVNPSSMESFSLVRADGPADDELGLSLQIHVTPSTRFGLRCKS